PRRGGPSGPAKILPGTGRGTTRRVVVGIRHCHQRLHQAANPLRHRLRRRHLPDAGRSFRPVRSSPARLALASPPPSALRAATSPGGEDRAALPKSSPARGGGPPAGWWWGFTATTNASTRRRIPSVTGYAGATSPTRGGAFAPSDPAPVGEDRWCLDVARHPIT